METGMVGKQLLDRYEVIEVIGRGGMGSVFKACDNTLERDVAVKVLHSHLAIEANFRERFGREAKTMAALNHPNIARVYDFGYDISAGAYCIIMEHLPSRTLADQMKRLSGVDLPTRLAEVRRILPPLADALAYAHERGMIHRDIKPCNVLFNEQGSPVLADFGLAKLIRTTGLTATGTTIGTPSYISPEQGMGREVDQRSDIYSLGVIAYEMLVGAVPFDADTPFGVIMKHVQEPLPSVIDLVPGLSPDVDVVLFRAMAKNPEERYRSATAFVDDMLASLSGEEISDDLPLDPDSTAQFESSVIASPKTPAAPSRSLLLLVGAVLLVILGIVGLMQILPRFRAGAAETDEPAFQMAESIAGDVFDDFNDPASGWPVVTEGPVQYGYQDGQYRFTNTRPGQAKVVTVNLSHTYENQLFMEVEATLIDGQPESGFGLVFRYQDPGNFYVFAIRGSGQVSIWVFENGMDWRELRGLDEEWTDSAAVKTDGSPNLIGVALSGDHLIGMVNYEEVIEVDDDTFGEGGVGLYVATTEQRVENPMADVIFDNFTAAPFIPSMTGE
jgi:serine/threonine protein kinase